MNKYKRHGGWYGESHRHYLAAKGVKTAIPASKLVKVNAKVKCPECGEVSVIPGEECPKSLRCGHKWPYTDEDHDLLFYAKKSETAKELPLRKAYNIEEKTLKNNDYRRVINTNKKLQVVLMSIPPGGDVGLEKHKATDQFFRVEQGKGKVVMNGKPQKIENATAFTVPAGTFHNVINTGKKDLKMYTLYAPPHHKPGIVRKTKKDAMEVPE